MISMTGPLSHLARPHFLFTAHNNKEKITKLGIVYVKITDSALKSTATYSTVKTIVSFLYLKYLKYVID